MKRTAALAVAALMPATLMLVAQAPDAQAATRNGTCETGEVCFYYGTGQSGALSDFTSSTPLYGTKTSTCFRFRSGGTGSGTCMQDKVASVWNRTSKPVTVYADSQYKGTSQVVAAGAKVNLKSGLSKNNGSHRIGGTTTGGAQPANPSKPTAAAPAPQGAKQKLSFALYGRQGRFTAGYDGYRNKALGRHEGLDFALRAGTPVYALTDGVITNVKRGTYGGSNEAASVIAVYLPQKNVTVVYLHTKVSPALAINQSIKRGQLLGTESRYGATGVHTHVEVRNQKRQWPTFSNDQTLANPNPASFWASQGYVVG